MDSVLFTSDYTYVHVENLPAGTSPEGFSRHLATLGVDAPPSLITLTTLSETTAVGRVCGAGHSFAEPAAPVIDGMVWEGRLVRAKPLQIVRNVGKSGGEGHTSVLGCPLLV